MKLLLDTHALIWWDSDPTQLSPIALAAIRDPANEVWLSVVSVWEMVIKVQLGKLTLRLHGGSHLHPVPGAGVVVMDSLRPAAPDRGW
jgi:PIN domain nuclease of toxin-antitoxin system